jgi:hypothetical protein
LTPFVCVALFAAELANASDPYTVNYNTTQDITAHSVCKRVRNLHASGASIFVPTNTSTEWASFYNNISTNTGGTVTAKGCPVTIYLTNTAATTWTVPADWDDAHNTIEVIAGGGGGKGDKRGGGGGGGYSKVTNANLPEGSNVTIKVGAGGAAQADGTDSYVCNSTSNCASLAGAAVVVGAQFGRGSYSWCGECANAGGSSASGVGSVKYSGGTGGAAQSCGSKSAGGGGGAAGPNGNGVNGLGCSGGAGDAGSGGAGGVGGNPAYAGSPGTEWGSYGSGGGGGGGSGSNSQYHAAGGLYGGAGGSDVHDSGGGVGGQGIIRIYYEPAY